MNFVINRAPDAGSIARPVDKQSSLLPLTYMCTDAPRYDNTAETFCSTAEILLHSKVPRNNFTGKHQKFFSILRCDDTTENVCIQFSGLIQQMITQKLLHNYLDCQHILYQFSAFAEDNCGCICLHVQCYHMKQPTGWTQ